MSRRRPGANARVVRYSVLFRLGRRRKALEAAKQIFLGHTVELPVHPEFDLSLRVRLDHRRRCLGLGLIDLDMLLQRVNEVLAQIAGLQLAVADFAQSDNGILVVVARRR